MEARDSASGQYSQNNRISERYNRVPKLTEPPKDQQWRSKVIAYNTQKLWTEVQVLNRLVYKSRNQLRTSFAYHRLDEIKRTMKRIGGLEVWLKINHTDKVPLANLGGSRDFCGYLNTLRLLLGKALEVCEKVFYYYYQWLEQAMFVQLALVVVGSISSVHRELKQWLKYLWILYGITVERLGAQMSGDELSSWMQANLLPDPKAIIEVSLQNLPIDRPASAPPSTGQRNASPRPAKPKTPLSRPGTPLPEAKKQRKDEIDDIFNRL